MIDYPFIDTHDITDEELQRRIQRCRQILSGEMRYGHSGMVFNIQQQLSVYEHEHSERMYKRRHDEYLEQNPDETIELGTIQGEETDSQDTKRPSKRPKDL